MRPDALLWAWSMPAWLGKALLLMTPGPWPWPWTLWMCPVTSLFLQPTCWCPSGTSPLALQWPAVVGPVTEPSVERWGRNSCVVSREAITLVRRSRPLDSRREPPQDGWSDWALNKGTWNA